MVYHLVRLLVHHNPSAAVPSPTTLSTVFTEFERLRMPRTAALVRKARAAGELRVVSGAEACRARDETVRAMWRGKERVGGDVGAVRALYADLVDDPYEAGKSEI